MNSMERMTRRLKGEPVDRVPNFDIMMNFAAHYIKKPLREYYLDYRVLVDANMAMLEDFELDIVQAISDPYRETHDLGGDIIFEPDHNPMCPHPPIVEYDDVKKLTFVAPEDGPRMSDRLKALRAFRDKVGGEVPIMGWVEGAFAQGADVRGINEIMVDVSIEPDWVIELLEKLVEVEIAFAREQIKAGADIIGLGDAAASMINRDMYQKFALPYEQRIFAAVHEMGALGRLHICGRTTHLLDLMVTCGADIIDVDWMVPFDKAAETFRDRVSICGNFDPVVIMLQGTADDVRRATKHCMDVGGPRMFSAGGCEIPDGTPHENLRAQNEMLVG
jgi:MtaA/CmuA family methyltransferase